MCLNCHIGFRRRPVILNFRVPIFQTVAVSEGLVGSIVVSYERGCGAVRETYKMKLLARTALVAVFGCALVAGAGAPRAEAATCPTIVLSGGGMITLGGAASGASCVAIGSGSVDTPAGYTLVNSLGGAGTDGILTVTNPTTGTGTFTDQLGCWLFVFYLRGQRRKPRQPGGLSVG